jgi:two-component sensor histidine kinase
VKLADVARESLEPYLMDGCERVSFSGPPVALDPKSAVALGIVFHELATNAIKHGALSNGEGKIAIAWRLDGDDTVSLVWQESGGPIVSPPANNGFGSRLIRLEITHELDGDVDFAYKPDGLNVTLGFPLKTADAKQDSSA